MSTPSSSQPFRIIQSFSQPSQVFTLYDYTKILYTIDSYLCIRQISLSQSKPSFIRLNHQYQKIHKIHSFNNLIVTLEEWKNQQYVIGFYDNIHLHVKINSSLIQEYIKINNNNSNNNGNNNSNNNLSNIFINSKPSFSSFSQFQPLKNKSLSSNLTKNINYHHDQQLQINFKHSTQNIFILISLSSINKLQQNDNQLIVLNSITKRIISRSFIQGNIKEIFIKQNDMFTVLYQPILIIGNNNNSAILVQYQLYQNNNQNHKINNIKQSISQKSQTNSNQQMYYIKAKRNIDVSNNNQSSNIQKVDKNNRNINHIHNNNINNNNNYSKHIWLKQQLILVNQKTFNLQVFVQSKRVQSISFQNFKSILHLIPLLCGFIITNQNFMQIYKKIQLQYICIAEYFIPQIGFSPKIVLSPQQDIISYFVDSVKSIKYITNFKTQTEFQNFNKKSVRNAKQLKATGQIKFKIDESMNIYANKTNNTFVINQQSSINLYGLNNLQPYLFTSIQSQQLSNSPSNPDRLKRFSILSQQQFTRPQSILTLAIHPYNQLISIVLKSKIRIYQILYNQLSFIKQLSISNCSQIFYSNSGLFLSVIVSGKKGSKCYIYKTQEDYELIECLTIGKKVQKFIWSKYDNFIYGIHNTGYYKWTSDNAFKNRWESIFNVTFNITNGLLNDNNDRIILYGDNHILQITQKIQLQNQIIHKDIIIIKPKYKIKQIIYQNNMYFINIIINTNQINQQIIIKSQQLINFSMVLQNNNYKNNNNLPLYQQQNVKNKKYKMIPCSGNTKKNLIFLVEENTRNIKVLEWGKTSLNHNVIRNTQLVKIDRKALKKLFKTYQKYQSDIRILQQHLHTTIQQMKNQLKSRQQQKQQSFVAQIKHLQQKYQLTKAQKQKLQHSMQQNISNHQKQTIKQIRQLQKIYERKIAITTNKLLTSEQINYRNMLLAEDNLKKLQKNSNNDIEKIRQQYKKELTFYMNQKDMLAEEIYKLKKDYQTRLFDLELENQKILEKYQNKSEDNISTLKKNIVAWEIKYSQVISKKDNIQKTLQQQLINSEILKQKINYLQSKNRQINKKCDYLYSDIHKYEQIIQQKNNAFTICEQRINDLQKSNEILKYRIIELKGQTQPQSQENIKLKDNLNQLQTEYDKIVKTAFQKQQILMIVKKQNEKNQQKMKKLQNKSKKIQKSYLDLFDKVMNITKSPIQQIRKQLINLLNNLKDEDKTLNRPQSSFNAANQSPLGQLNRIRQHLQICLNQAVDSNKKGEQQKKVQLMKKNRQNSQLLKQINDLRRRVKQLQSILKQKQLHINRLIRGDPIVNNQISPQFQLNNININNLNQQQRPYMSINKQIRQNVDMQNQSQIQSGARGHLPSQQSRSGTRKYTRQTKQSFFERSLFKTNVQWKQKRLKTQHSQHSQKRYSNSRSVKRNTSNKYLEVQNNGHSIDQIQDYKRVIQQKQAIIKQLINKIQSLS